jgi:hypothetical protein
MVAFTPTHLRLTGVLPWRYGSSSAYGVKVFQDTATPPSWWACTANQVYRCPGDAPASNAGQRVSFNQSQIASCQIHQPGNNRAGRGKLTVLNPGGALSNAGLVGQANQALRQWSQVAISLGYRTAAGVETIAQAPLWVDAIEFHDETALGTPLVTLHLIDAWALLERLSYRQSVTFTNQTPEFILDQILWHVCGTLGGTGNSRLGAFALSTFTVHAGESLAAVARRLVALGAVELVFRAVQGGGVAGDGIGPGSVSCVGVSRGAGGPVYSYGGSGQQPILSSHLRPLATPAATSFLVDGSTTASLTRNWEPTWLLGRDLMVRKVDKALGNQPATDAVASDAATWYAPELAGGTLTVLVNVGQEVADQVSLTVPTAPISSAVYTVDGYSLHFDQRDGRILQTLTVVGTN